MPCTPSVCSASLTLSSRWGRMIASIFFMGFPPKKMYDKLPACRTSALFNDRSRRDCQAWFDKPCALFFDGDQVKVKIVALFAMLREIKPLNFIFSRHAHTDCQIDHFQ